MYSGRKRIQHYAQEADIQMAAMLACTFAVFNDSAPNASLNIKSVEQDKTTTGGCLDAQTVHMYACLKRAYADMLLRWQMFYTRAVVMKRVMKEEERLAGPELASECAWCGALVKAAACPACRAPALRCVVCELGVRGVAVSCSECGHAGHVAHMAQWFSMHDSCPAPCPCKCVALADLVHHYWTSPKLL